MVALPDRLKESKHSSYHGIVKSEYRVTRKIKRGWISICKVGPIETECVPPLKAHSNSVKYPAKLIEEDNAKRPEEKDPGLPYFSMLKQFRQIFRLLTESKNFRTRKKEYYRISAEMGE